MRAPMIDLDGGFLDGTVRIVHGGEEGTQLRAAILAENVVTVVALVPSDWADQDPGTRWAPDTGEVRLLGNDEQHIGPGWRLNDGQWVEPQPVEPMAPPEPPQPTLAELQADLARITAQMQRLADGA